MSAATVRTVVQHGPKDKKVAAFAIDWPGWSRGAKAGPAAVELLEAYRERYRPIAVLAGLGTEFEAAGPLEIVEDHVGVGSTDFWGISFAPSSQFEMEPMPAEVIERRLTLLQAAWHFFDEVAARVSPELAKGPRGGGRSRDEIIRHALGWERADLVKRVGIVAEPVVPDLADGLRSHRAEYVAALREYNAEGKVPGGRNWTVALLLRHSAFHVLDHAWEMEDKDLTTAAAGTSP
jgi:hypothetical protein